MNERERFEAAMQAQGYKPYNFGVAMVGGPYRNSHVQAAYEGWQAALADRPEPAQAWDDIEVSLRHLYGVSIVDGERRITAEGLRYSLSIRGRGRWSCPPPRGILVGAKAICSCCSEAVNAVRNWETLQICNDCWTRATAPQEPAQPVATVVDAPMCRANTSWAIDVQLPVGTKLYAAPPSHPAPSEAAPERQDGRVILAATALVQWWARAKNPPLPNDWNAHLGRLQEDLMAAVNAKPAKGEGKP